MDARAPPPLLSCSPLGGAVAAAVAADADAAVFQQLPVKLRDMRPLLWPLVLLEVVGGTYRCHSVEYTVLLEQDRRTKMKPSALGLWPFMCTLDASSVFCVRKHVEAWGFDYNDRRFHSSFTTRDSGEETTKEAKRWLVGLLLLCMVLVWAVSFAAPRTTYEYQPATDYLVRTAVVVVIAVTTDCQLSIQMSKGWLVRS